MKKLNKKGFTLVELLVVIVILVVIMSIAIPSITSSIERSKNKELNYKKELIVSAAELYADKHKNSFNPSVGVSVDTLLAEGLLTSEEVKNPITKNIIEGCIKANATGKLELTEESC